MTGRREPPGPTPRELLQDLLADVRESSADMLEPPVLAEIDRLLASTTWMTEAEARAALAREPRHLEAALAVAAADLGSGSLERMLGVFARLHRVLDPAGATDFEYADDEKLKLAAESITAWSERYVGKRDA